MLKCIDFEKMILTYIDNELDKNECDKLVAHLSICQECKAQEVLFRSIKETLSNEVEVELPDDFNIKLHNKLLVESEKIKNENVKIYKFKNIKVVSTLAAGFLILILGASLISSGFFNISLSKRASDIKETKSISKQELAVNDDSKDNYKRGEISDNKLNGNLYGATADVIKEDEKVAAKETSNVNTKEITKDIAQATITTTTNDVVIDAGIGITTQATTGNVNKDVNEVSPKAPQLMKSTVLADVANPNVVSVKSKNKDEDSKKLALLTDKYSNDKVIASVAADQANNSISASSFTLKSKIVEESKKSFSININSSKFDAFKAELEECFGKTNVSIIGDITKVNTVNEKDLDLNIEINLVD